MFTLEERASIIALLEKGIVSEVNGKITIGQTEYRWDICRINDHYTGKPWFCASIGYETMGRRETAEAAMDDLEKALTGLRACESFIGAVLAD